MVRKTILERLGLSRSTGPSNTAELKRDIKNFSEAIEKGPDNTLTLKEKLAWTSALKKEISQRAGYLAANSVEDLGFSSELEGIWNNVQSMHTTLLALYHGRKHSSEFESQIARDTESDADLNRKITVVLAHEDIDIALKHQFYLEAPYPDADAFRAVDIVAREIANGPSSSLSVDEKIRWVNHKSGELFNAKKKDFGEDAIYFEKMLEQAQSTLTETLRVLAKERALEKLTDEVHRGPSLDLSIDEREKWANDKVKQAFALVTKSSGKNSESFNARLQKTEGLLKEMLKSLVAERKLSVTRGEPTAVLPPKPTLPSERYALEMSAKGKDIVAEYRDKLKDTKPDEEEPEESPRLQDQ
ncbi:MAG: hypothetical protein K0U37_06695 [Gammaproteobacteria bacterium]|nr:hypothetical protein [Gammaproteobacteria bacterium]